MSEHGEIAVLVVLVLVAYALGSIPWGLVIGRAKGLDIRKHGSGNIGATNVRRVLGRRCGILCCLLDIAKGLVPVLIAAAVTGSLQRGTAVVPALCAGAAVAGHVWPITLGFKGGKGVATTIGAILALAPWSVLIALLGWYAVFRVSRYVSVASMAAAVILPASAAALNGLGLASVRRPTLVLLLLLAVLIIVRHRTNLVRLFQGTENRFERKPKPDDSQG